MTDKFNPTDHLMDIGRGKKYLQVQHRVMWFKDTHPKGQILTEVVSLDPVVMKATITDNDGNIIATGHGSAQSKANAVWSGRELEKAETAAIGRALGLAGFGTQFASEFADGEDDYLADSPQAPKSAQNSPSKPSNAAKGKSTHNGAQNGSQSEIPADKATDHVLLRSLEIVDKDGQKRLKFKSDDGRTVLAFTRQLFKERGWIDDAEWMGVGDYPIKDGIPVGITFHRINDDGGYWEVTAVSEVVF